MIDTDTYQRVLGTELRKLREGKGWTRKDLNERLQSEISLQTLATYELGTRQCSVIRLVELCRAMGERPQDLLARVHEQVCHDEPEGLRVNLAHVVADGQPGLAPLRRWAQGRLDGARTPEVQLDVSALEQMAQLCDIPTQDLIARLRDISGSDPR